MVGLILLPLMFSCSTYKAAERHMNRKMTKAQLVNSTWVNDSNNDTVEYWDNLAIDKPTLILVHGFGASTKYQFSDQVKMLSEEYRLVLPNLYQFGNTRPGSEKCAVTDQVDLVNSLINHLNIDSFSLVGVSYGALVGIELASRRKADIDKLVLFDAPIKYLDSADISSVQNYFEVPNIEELFAPSEPEGLKKLLFLATGKKSHVPTFLLKEFHQEAYVKTLKEKQALITCLIGNLEEYQQREYKLDLPTLLIWGENDMVVSAEKGKLLQQHLGDKCEYQVIENAAHMPNMTKTKKFNRILKAFLSN